MTYLSALLGARVTDRNGRPIGRVADLAVRPGSPHPTVSALVMSHARGRVAIPWAELTELDSSGAQLRTQGHVFGTVDPEAVLLGRDVLDTQIVDLAGRRLTRVADVELSMIDTGLRVTAVDVSPGAVIRRLGMRRLADRLAPQMVAWERLHPLAGRPHRLVEDDSPPPPTPRPQRYHRLIRRRLHERRRS
jgi:sporulation protein YlmC with PRC-barrel domain